MLLFPHISAAKMSCGFEWHFYARFRLTLNANDGILCFEFDNVIYYYILLKCPIYVKLRECNDS